jgi:molybdopterin-guanine dinucleotide biosynthesis protein MobB
LRIFGITGWKNNGKTRLVVGLVQSLTARGLKVSTIKHAHHSFDIDHPGRDSYQHREAGATEVIVASAARFAVIHE